MAVELPPCGCKTECHHLNYPAEVAVRTCRNIGREREPVEAEQVLRWYATESGGWDHVSPASRRRVADAADSVLSELDRLRLVEQAATALVEHRNQHVILLSPKLDRLINDLAAAVRTETP